MDKIQLIKEEIERRKTSLLDHVIIESDKQYVIRTAHQFNSLIDFIDSLQEVPTSEDLDEYYRKEFLPREWFNKPGRRTISEFNRFTAEHFAEWQRKQMLKNTVLETKVFKNMDGDGLEVPYTEWLELENNEILEIPERLGLKDGDKVKIIIVKTEQQ